MNTILDRAWTTENFHRVDKLIEYAEVPSLAVYVLLELDGLYRGLTFSA